VDESCLSCGPLKRTDLVSRTYLIRMSLINEWHVTCKWVRNMSLTNEAVTYRWLIRVCDLPAFICRFRLCFPCFGGSDPQTPSKIIKKFFDCFVLDFLKFFFDFLNNQTIKFQGTECSLCMTLICDVSCAHVYVCIHIEIRMNESWLHMNEACCIHSRRYVGAHTSRRPSHTTRQRAMSLVNGSCHTSMCHAIYEWVMSRLWMSLVLQVIHWSAFI